MNEPKNYFLLIWDFQAVFNKIILTLANKKHQTSIDLVKKAGNLKLQSHDKLVYSHNHRTRAHTQTVMLMFLAG